MTLQEAQRNVVFFPQHKGTDDYGCGFFIAPNYILTAGHVLRQDTIGDKIEFLYQGNRYSATLIKRSPDRYEKSVPPDVALLQTDCAIGPECEYTLDLPLSDEKLTARIVSADGNIEECDDFKPDGKRFIDDIPDVIGLSRNAAIVPGWSGAPVFRSSDSRIMGYLRITRDPHAGQGGYFVPLVRLVKVLPELQLQTTYEQSALPDTLENIFDLLTYTSRLTPFIGSMNEELDALEAWAIDGDASPKIRLVSGPGGSGKSRLAFELIQRVRQRGVSADFYAENPPMDAHALVVVDYPEQQLAQLKYLKALSAKTIPIRVLLLSRCSLQDLIEQLQEAGAGRILDGHSVSMSYFSTAEVSTLYQACSVALQQKYHRPMPDISDGDLAAWIAQNPSLHTLPLFVRALALEVALTGYAALSFTTEGLLKGLVRRERERLRVVSLGAGFEAESLSMLSAFAAIRPKLSCEDIKSFQPPELEVFTSPFGKNRLGHLPWFQENSWLPPSPDILAAALVYTVFQENEHMASVWLWKLLENAEQNMVANLDRLLYDIGRVFGSGQIEFSRWLKEIVRKNPERAASLREFTSTSSRALSDFGAAIGHILVQSDTADSSNRATIFYALSTCLSRSGDRVGALKAIQEAVAIYQSLAKENPAVFEADLAKGLNNLSLWLSECGDLVGALEAIQESLAMYQRLAHQNPEAFGANVAGGLSNLSLRLRASGDRGGALEAIQESVAIYQRLAIANPTAFEGTLAGCLNNLSLGLSDSGDRVGALNAIQASVEIFRRLAQANPAAFEADLALGLITLALRLRDSGDRGGALAASQESVTIYQRLVQANPVAFEADLAKSILALANSLRDSGDRVGALKAIQESIAMYRRLAESNRAAFVYDLAKSLNNFSNCLSENGDGGGALEAIEESVAIYRRLADANPAAFEADLALGLNTLSLRLSAKEDRVGALKAMQESVAIYQHLANANPAAFHADLARGLNNLSNRLSASGDHVEALKASKEAVAIYQSLADANPAAFSADLAKSLLTLSNHLSDNQDHVQALKVVQESVAMYQRLATANPGAFEADLAMGLNNLSFCLRDSGDRVGARNAIQESVGIYQRLATANPAVFDAELAGGLNNIANLEAE